MNGRPAITRLDATSGESPVVRRRRSRPAGARSGNLEPVFGPVLGIDPGLSRCGYGAILRQGGETHAVAYGVIRTAPALPVPERLAILEGELEALVAEVAPAVVAVERVFFQVNVRTAMSVGQASGLALAVSGRAGVPVIEYTPNEVKQAVAGYGAADKAQVQSLVQRLLRLAEAPPPDAADALALALCHSSSARLRARIGAAGSEPTSSLARAIEAAGGVSSGPARNGTVPGLARAIEAASKGAGRRRAGGRPIGRAQ